MVLVGRDEELANLRRALRSACSGRTQVVVIEGGAGSGKSALLNGFIDNDTATVPATWLRCDQIEQSVAFSSAELLLGEPIDPACSELEVGRRLLAHLGDGDHADGATVLAVDDAHWMDGPSVRAFRFALRRLQVEPILVVVARRPSPSETDFLITEDPRATTVLHPE